MSLSVGLAGTFHLGARRRLEETPDEGGNSLLSRRAEQKGDGGGSFGEGETGTFWRTDRSFRRVNNYEVVS